MKIVVITKKFSKICVVENIADHGALKVQIFLAVISTLGGTISETIDKKQRLLVDSLVQRVKNKI